MRIFNAKAVFCNESDKLKNFTNVNYNNLSQKRKIKHNKLQKEIKYKFNAKTS